ncbi:MAG: hypothetical protein HY907_13585 [Deltaproteobacteria bacterium]|nr:hypothetical protein [Deltaproteobacteria bacterium]
MEFEAEQKALWDGGGWNPMPLAMPWTWAQFVPAGFVLSAAVGVGDLTATDVFDAQGSAAEGFATLRRVDQGLSLPMPAFVGYRLHAAPMFAAGAFFQYQLHDVYLNDDPRLASRSDGKAFSLYGGVKVRTYFPLGLLEPWIGIGAGYAQAEQTYRDDYGTTQFTHSLQGAVLPLEVGLDFVPWDYLSAGFSFLYGFGLWQEYCQRYSRDNSNVCVGPDDAEWPKDPPDLWTFDFHVNFYLR